MTREKKKRVYLLTMASIMCSTVLLSAVVRCITAADAESPYCMKWSQTWGGISGDGAYGLSVSSDGIYVSGYTSSFGAGASDAFMAKFASNGTQLWNCTWGGAGDERGFAVAAASDGIYLSGYSSSFGAGSYDAFIVKYAANGTQLWNRTWGGTADDRGFGVAVATDGIYLSGYTSSFGAGASDAFIAKFAENGTQLWNRTWGGTADDRGFGVAVATDGIY
ncbi:MAG: PQQ-like beta-propeller repeat protein, partial [Candidatus Lokiarchaeota archaeon]|nr:PQQ-like beta-propeller repeat protein [Candidatus Lokiarchaeota archaeon]